MKRDWECWECGFIFEKESKPHICPNCKNVHLMNNEAFFIELPRSRKPLLDKELRQYSSNKNDNTIETGNHI